MIPNRDGATTFACRQSGLRNHERRWMSGVAAPFRRTTALISGRRVRLSRRQQSVREPAAATLGEEALGTQQPRPFVDSDCARERADQSRLASRADSRASCFVFRLSCRHSGRDFSSPFLHSALASRAP